MSARGRLWASAIVVLACICDPPCCSDDACTPQLDSAQSPNAINVLLRDCFTNTMPAFDTKKERKNMHTEGRRRKRQGDLLSRTAMHSSKQSAGSWKRGTSRNLVLVTLESVSAMHLGLYNQQMQTRDPMPFLTQLMRTSRDATMVNHMYATEPNTLHSFYASHCGIRPHLGVKRAEYETTRYMNACLPTLLRERGIHSALFSTSRISLQHELGFDTIWSSMLLEKAAQTPQYNYLGHDDFSGLPEIEAFINNAGDDRFMLSLLTLNSHAPYHAAPEYSEAWGCPLVRNQSSQDDSLLSSIPGVRFFSGSKLSRTLRADSSRYLRELHCADMYLQRLYQILDNADRLKDTSILVVADHGEGFMQYHADDVGHGGTAYDTQLHIPFVLVGPAAHGIPRSIAGVWSDTSIMHTILDALGLPKHPLREVIAEHAQQYAVPSAQAQEGLGVQASDLMGMSVLSNWHTPPMHAYMSCAFENVCVGLRDVYIKWIYRMENTRMSAYYWKDANETINVAAAFASSHKESIKRDMKRWIAAVNSLYSGAKKITRHECPFHVPYRMMGSFTHYTHCCSVKPKTELDRYNRRFQLCPNGTKIECPNLPCLDNEARLRKTGRKQWVAHRRRFRTKAERQKQQMNHSVDKKSHHNRGPVVNPHARVSYFEGMSKVHMTVEDALAASRWIRHSKVGTCHFDMRNQNSSCENGIQGSFVFDFKPGGWPKLMSRCINVCRKCAKCNFMSASYIHRTCRWFAQCSLDELEGSSAFRSGPKIALPGDKAPRITGR